MNKVTDSVTGEESQIPFMPKKTGRTKIDTSKTKNPREKEINADSFALPIDVK